MKELCRNIYKKARKNAGIEQIEAADALGVSARSLQNYESELNPTVPPLDVVRNMCILYKDKNLAYKHIKKSPIGEFLPDMAVPTSLTIATLSTLDGIQKIQNQITNIISITKDGVVDNQESEDWAKICDIGNELIRSLNSLINSKGSEIKVN